LEDGRIANPHKAVVTDLSRQNNGKKRLFKGRMSVIFDSAANGQSP
jgi:hypothetical protein